MCTKVPSNDFQFTVVSYNVLAQSYVHRHQKDLYSQSLPHVLEWSFRRDLILRRILSFDADVICLQEVEKEHYYDFFVPALHAHGYDSRFKKRTNMPTDGLAVFYRKRKLSLMKCHPVELNKGIEILDRDNVALIMMLEPVVDIYGAAGDKLVYQGLDPVCIVTTHLLFNPARGMLQHELSFFLFDFLGKILPKFLKVRNIF
jgi:mRNA deadenylase 3'-5' endonuclease subunit Ccr4